VRRFLVIVVSLLLLLAVGVYILARAVLGSDLVRSSLEQQLAVRLGQPVSIQAATAAIYPRVSLNLRNVSIGAPPSIQIENIRIATGLRPLFSRTVSGAEIVLADARVTLPLPFSFSAPAPSSPTLPSGGPAAPAFTVASIDRVSIRNLTLTAGPESLVIDAESSLVGDRLEIARLTARAGRTQLEASGAMTSIDKMQASLEAKADPLDLDELVRLASAMTSTSQQATTTSASRDSGSMHVVVKLAAASGSFGAYSFTDLSSTIEMASARLSLSPLSVASFGGTFSGRLDADTSTAVPSLVLKGRVQGLDVPALLKASGSPGGITGRLGGTVALTAAAADFDTLLRSARGRIDAAVTDGSIPGLDMVRTIVLAFGKPSGAPPAGSGSAFSRLGGDFTLSGGTLTSETLALTSRDFDMAGRGSLQLFSGQVSARADVILSQELTTQAGTDLRRYAQEDGRVVVPATIGGTLERPSVSLDITAAAKRAIGNELKRRTKSFIEGLFKKK
jgi:uncharacterized protein involved in outer membrane biogenesis